MSNSEEIYTILQRPPTLILKNSSGNDFTSFNANVNDFNSATSLENDRNKDENKNNKRTSLWNRRRHFLILIAFLITIVILFAITIIVLIILGTASKYLCSFLQPKINYIASII